MSRLTPAVRHRIYLVVTAVAPLLVGYGLLSESEVSLWLAVAGAALGAGGTTLAAAHTPRKGDGE